MTTPTPGPWIVRSPKPARFPAYSIVHRDSDTDVLVAEVKICAGNPASQDARLIAAAPELLEALKRMREMCERYMPDLIATDPDHEFAHADNFAIAAITKAEGW